MGAYCEPGARLRPSQGDLQLLPQDLSVKLGLLSVGVARRGAQVAAAPVSPPEKLQRSLLPVMLARLNAGQPGFRKGERLPFLLLLWSITDTPVPTLTPPPFSSFLPTPSQCLRPDQGRAGEASCLLARGLRTLTTKKDPKLQSPGKGRRWGEGEKRSRESLQGPQHTLEVRRFPAQKRDPSWAAGSHARQPHCATRHLKHTGRA